MRTPMIFLAIGGLSLATAGLAAESNSQTQSHQGLAATTSTTAGQTLATGESQINLSNGCQIRFFEQASQIPTGQQQVQLNSSCK